MALPWQLALLVTCPAPLAGLALTIAVPVDRKTLTPPPSESLQVRSAIPSPLKSTQL
ncbi:membrane or secreted protein [Candidatus Magnetoovum chiemensis]|nr:membrane or secreted protein [Candidatus Magnetoovum chiemensis]